MLTELSVVEQRYIEGREVLEGAKISDVAIRYGVDRRSVHRWLLRYANEGLGALSDRSSRPDRCPHQTPPEVEARIVALAGRIGDGARGRSFRSSDGSSMSRRRALRSTGAWFATASSHRSLANDGRASTGAGSAPARWIFGRWTSWAGSHSQTAPSSRRSPGSMT